MYVVLLEDRRGVTPVVIEAGDDGVGTLYRIKGEYRKAFGCDPYRITIHRLQPEAHAVDILKKFQDEARQAVLDGYDKIMGQQ